MSRTPQTICDRQALLGEFDRIRQRGCAMDTEKNPSPVVSALARDHSGRQYSGRQFCHFRPEHLPTVRITPDRELEIARAVLDAARAAAHELSGFNFQILTVIFCRSIAAAMSTASEPR
ncbi:MAG: IclR family transcriptional regulator domain-containing protein [Acidobacteriota bacterium]